MSPLLIRLRHALHREPELAYQETLTAKRCACDTRKLGYRVRTGYAKTGFIADLGVDSPLIAIRAELDALPIQTTLTTSYASRVPAKMHACGHDAHMAMTVGAASLLAKLFFKQGLPGRVRFIFQPAEEAWDDEGKSGAVRMVEQGALKGVQALIAQHGMPDIPVGKVAILNGPVMAASSPFQISICGNGGHIAEPDRTIDTILIASLIRTTVATRLKEITARLSWEEMAPIIGFGAFVCDSETVNIVPKEVTLKGSIRSFSVGDQKCCQTMLSGICEEICSQHGARFKIKYLGDTPTTYNTPAIAAVMRQAARSVLGSNSLIKTSPRYTAEDFAFYGAKTQVPTAFMLTGTGQPGQIRRLHAPDYDVPEEVLPIGAAILAEAALRLMSAKR